MWAEAGKPGTPGVMRETAQAVSPSRNPPWTGGALVNAALLLVTAWVVGADPVPADSYCPTGECYDASGEEVRPRLIDRLKFKLKCQECGSHIHCPYPGVIPNTEHPTLCQRFVDWCCRNQSTHTEFIPCDVPPGVTHQGSSPLPYSMYGAAPLSDSEGLDTCSMTEMPSPVYRPQAYTMLKPREHESLSMPRRVTSVPAHSVSTSPYNPRPERVPAMPSKFDAPRELDLGPSPE